MLIEDVIEPYPMRRRIPLSGYDSEVAQYWCYRKNCGFGPEDFSYGSNVEAWWYCVFDKQHVFQQAIGVRVQCQGSIAHGCPFCASKLLTAENSLQFCDPAVAAQWHPTKNGTLRPTEVMPLSNLKAWWLCPQCKHGWQAVIANRVGRAENCPYCASRKVAPFNSLRKLFPKVARDWHKKKNNGLTPDQVTSKSNQVAWWQCRKSPEHEWKARVQDRTEGSTGCPFCAGRSVCRTNSLKALSPKLAREWHPTKNGNCTPGDVTTGSKKIIWWRCAVEPRHEWKTDVGSRSRGNGCPYCRGTKVDDTNSLAAIFPKIAKEWHPTKNGDLKPRDVTTGSKKKIWWRCAVEPRHEWETDVGSRSNGHGCPYCKGRKVDDTNSLAALFPNLAKEWHPTNNGKLTADHVTTGSTKRAWWRCSKNKQHEWETRIHSRSLRGFGCPFCRSAPSST
jgi:positive regulator of sigma E activity